MRFVDYVKNHVTFLVIQMLVFFSYFNVYAYC